MRNFWILKRSKHNKFKFHKGDLNFLNFTSLSRILGDAIARGEKQHPEENKRRQVFLSTLY